MKNALKPAVALCVAAVLGATDALADGSIGAASPVPDPSAASADQTKAPTAEQVIDKANAMALVSTVNGTVPPGEPTLVKTSAEVMNVINEAKQLRVYRDVREAGTRAPIHVHPFGGWTCVVSGQAVLYLEGAAPARTEAGECVYMPPLTPMSNVNPGPGPAVLLDNFVTPPDAPVWRILEIGQTGLGNEFAHSPSEQVNPQ